MSHSTVLYVTLLACCLLCYLSECFLQSRLTLPKNVFPLTALVKVIVWVTNQHSPSLSFKFRVIGLMAFLLFCFHLQSAQIFRGITFPCQLTWHLSAWKLLTSPEDVIFTLVILMSARDDQLTLSEKEPSHLSHQTPPNTMVVSTSRLLQLFVASFCILGLR